MKKYIILFSAAAITFAAAFHACKGDKPTQEATVTSITVTTPPSKSTYEVGEAFNPAGMVISVSWSDGKTTTVNVPANGTLPQGVTVSGFDPAKSGTQTITVTYNGKSATFDVTVNAAKPAFVAVTDITGVATAATVGTPLSLTGTVAPTDATNKTIAWTVKSGAATISGGNTLNATAAGTVVITATIAGGTTATTPYTKDFNINVTAASTDGNSGGLPEDYEIKNL